MRVVGCTPHKALCLVHSLSLQGTVRRRYGPKKTCVVQAWKGGGVTLAEEFRELCQTYFPRWRAATAWCLEESPCAAWINAQGKRQATPERGYCDPSTRRITIHVSPENVLQRQATIIHEICHAITTVGH